MLARIAALRASGAIPPAPPPRNWAFIIARLAVASLLGYATASVLMRYCFH